MMKHLLPLLVTVFLVRGAFAAPVVGADAAAAARAWLSTRGHFGLRGGASVERIAEHRTEEGNRFFAVKLAGSGTVFTSGDTFSEPIVAFTDSTNDFSTIDRASPLWALLRRDADVRAKLRARRPVGFSRNALRWRQLTSTAATTPSAATNRVAAVDDIRVAPLLKTRWGQQSAGGKPCFNYYTTNHYPCGCTATATAQIMKYFRYPTAAVPARIVACTVSGVRRNLTTRGGVFAWDQMVDVPSVGNYSDAAWAAIGHLTYDVSVALMSEYASGGTSAWAEDVPAVLTDVFGYSQAMYYGCDDVAYEAWTNGVGRVLHEAGLHIRANRQKAIAASLDAGLPVLLAIHGFPNGYVGVESKWAGHAVVGDGYGYVVPEEGGEPVPYVHVNMGWTGTDDAWYNVPEIQTSETGASVYDGSHDFTVLRGCVYNVMTNGTGVVVSGRIFDTSGAPQAGVRVAIDGTAQETVSNEKGGYFLVVPPETTMTVRAVDETEGMFGERIVTTGCDSAASIGNVWGADIVLDAICKAPTPAFVPAGCTFISTTNVTILCSDVTATIRYTLDGSDPDAASPVYETPIRLDATTTVKARAYVEGREPSDIAAATYTWRRPAGDIYVSATAGSDDESAGDAAHPFATIQYAIAHSYDGDVINVGPGVYAGPIETPAHFLDIISTDGAEATVIDGQNADLCYFGLANVTNGLVGFTLRNGCYLNGGGAWGGILVDCVISNCQAVWTWDDAQYGPCGYGGGAAEANLLHCILVDNVGDNEGGAAANCYLGDCVVSRCRSQYGGGASCSIVENSLVVGCSADIWGGGAIDGEYWNATLANNTAAGAGGGLFVQEPTVIICNTILSDNACGAGSRRGDDLFLGASCATSCIFVGPTPGFVDAATGNYRLTARSPCIDVGDSAETLVDYDLAGNNRFVGLAVDIGCYEYQLDPSWPDPGVTPLDTPAAVTAKVNAAMRAAGFSEELAAAVTTPALYAALLEWADANGVSRAAQNASPVALLSPALGAPGLMTDFSSADFVISAATPANGAFVLTLDIAGYDPTKVDERLLKAAIGLIGSETVSGNYSADGLSCEVVPTADSVKVMVTPPATAAQYFMKGRVR